MAATAPEQLNSLFLLLHRSLLQYLGECSPWTAEDSRQSQTLAAIAGIVAEQKRDEGLLAAAMQETGWVIDYGTYPTSFTDLHYVSLKYLLKQIIESQKQILKAIDAALSTDPESPVLTAVAKGERDILKVVEGLSAPSPTIVAA